jgi:hypothetical protein
MGTARVNIYLAEPGAGSFVEVPRVFYKDREFIDRDGKIHRLAYSNFDDEIGMNLSDTIDPKTVLSRKDVLSSILGAGTYKVPKSVDLQTTPWAVSYFANSVQEKYEQDGYFGMLGRARSDSSLGQKSVLILDFSDPELSMRALDNTSYGREFTHVFPGKKPFVGKDPGVIIIHVGPKDHRLFTSALWNSQLPSEITGTRSFEEAIIFRRLFDYEKNLWKGDLVASIFRIAISQLSERDAKLSMAALFGYEGIEKPEVYAEDKREAAAGKLRGAFYPNRQVKGEYGPKMFYDAETQNALQQLNDKLLEQPSAADGFIKLFEELLHRAP